MYTMELYILFMDNRLDIVKNKMKQKNLELELPYDPAIPLLGIHTRETRSERDTCTPIFIAALFIMPGHGSNLDAHQQTNG